MPMRSIAALAALLIPAAVYAQTAAQSGQTNPQRTIQENRITKQSEDGKQQGTPSNRVIESMSSSTEDLNSIRDAYLRVLSGDGCPPDVAARVAQLRTLVGEKKPGRNGAQRGASASAQKSAADFETSMLALALDWDNRQADPSTFSNSNSAARGKLLESALAPPSQGAAGAAAADMATLRAELDRLLSTCRAPQR